MADINNKPIKEIEDLSDKLYDLRYKEMMMNIWKKFIKKLNEEESSK